MGKTHVTVALITALVADGYRVGGLKPVASGCSLTDKGLRNSDAEAIIAAANLALDYETVNPYAFQPAIAPHIAANESGISIDLANIVSSFKQAQPLADWILVEGVGGWSVPLSDKVMVSDMALSLELPVLLVVGMRLGCINHAILTANAIRASGAELVGWVANSPSEAMPRYRENLATLDQQLGVPRIGELPYQYNALVYSDMASKLDLTRLLKSFS